MPLFKHLLYQKERTKIIPQGTAVKENMLKWFLLWQAQKHCACSQYIEDYDSMYLQHKGKAYFSCTVYIKCTSDPPDLQ